MTTQLVGDPMILAPVARACGAGSNGAGSKPMLRRLVAVGVRARVSEMAHHERGDGR
ncbi:hypothetical protein ACFTZJ_21875 [Streptomyces globisporus]|uniref:hypothetical protein n=1 Tax=Streptomyces globisporus TaxID=1908 RepID=UPI00362E163C